MRLADRSLRQTNPVLGPWPRCSTWRRPGDRIGAARPGRHGPGEDAVRFRRRRAGASGRLGPGRGGAVGHRRGVAPAVPHGQAGLRRRGRRGSTGSLPGSRFQRTRPAWSVRCYPSTTSTAETSIWPGAWPNSWTGSEGAGRVWPACSPWRTRPTRWPGVSDHSSRRLEPTLAAGAAHGAARRAGRRGHRGAASPSP